MKLIIMAAGSGRRMGEMLRGRPKCLLEVDGRSLLDRQLGAWGQAQALSLRDVVVVTGHGAEHLEALRERGCTLVHNARHATTNMVASLFCAADHFGAEFVMSYGDIAYQPEAMRRVLESPAPVSVVVDRAWRAYWQARFGERLLDDAESLATDGHGWITSIGQKGMPIDEIEAQYIGLVAFRGEGVGQLREAFALAQRGGTSAGRVFTSLERRPAELMFMTDLLQGLVNLGARVAAVPIEGGWVEVDSPRDLEIARARLTGSGVSRTCVA